MTVGAAKQGKERKGKTKIKISKSNYGGHPVFLEWVQKVWNICADCSLQRMNNNWDRVAFVKKANKGGGNGSNHKTTNKSTTTKITPNVPNTSESILRKF